MLLKVSLFKGVAKILVECSTFQVFIECFEKLKGHCNICVNLRGQYMLYKIKIYRSSCIFFYPKPETLSSLLYVYTVVSMCVRAYQHVFVRIICV